MADTAGTLAESLAQHRAGRLDEASGLYRAVLALDPDPVEALHHLGLANYQRGDVREAIALMDRAMSLDDGNARHHVNRGLMQRRLGRRDDAEASYRRALAIDAGPAEALNNLATLFAERGDLGSAIASCNAALRLAPDYRLFSLQKGPAAAQVFPPPPGATLDDLGPELDDLAVCGGRDLRAGPRGFRTYVRCASGRRTRQARPDPARGDAGLALDAVAHGQSLVLECPAVPSGQTRRVGPGSRRGRRGASGHQSVSS
jgi:tetratricopeptide (TPR) repeat protein